MNRVSVSGSTTVEVGLFGLHTKISRVRSVMAASIASRSKVWSVNGTLTAVAPATWTDRRVELEATPAEDHLVAGRGGDLNELLAQVTEPLPTAMFSGAKSEPRCMASAALRATLALSG